MAGKMRKVLALALTLSLCTGQLTIPVSAAQRSRAGRASPVMEVTVTPIGNGIKKVSEGKTKENISDTTTVETHTIVTETNVSTETNGIYENIDTTTTEITETTTEQLPPGDTPDEEGFTSQGGTETTVVDSTETKTESDINNGPEYPMYESEKVEGEETTTVTSTETKTKQETSDPTTETTDNEYETIDEDPGEYTQKDPQASQGQGTETDANISQKPGNVTLNMSQTSKTDSKTIYLDVERAVQENIDIPTAGTTTTENEDGSKTIREVIYIYDETDKDLVIGYTVTETTVETHVDEDEDYTRGESTPGADDGSTRDVPVDPETSETFTLPARPKGGVRRDANGNTVIVTVEEVKDDEGKVIGFKSITKVTDKDGNLVSTGSETIYGTTKTTNTSTEMMETTNVTDTTLTKEKTTTTTYTKITDAEGKELVVMDGQWYYKAELDAVKAGTSHGATIITPVTPTDVVLYYEDGTKKIGTFDRVNNTSESSGDAITANDQYSVLYDGVRAEGSEHDVKTSEGTSWAHTFQLMDEKGNAFLVYCIDYATHATPDYEYTMENIADANYYKGEGAAQHIQGIGLNGYWGSQSGIGSLQHVKDQLQAAYTAAKNAGESFILTEAQVNDLLANLTEGEALTATQAAFWQYGNSGSVTVSATQENARITNLMNWLASVQAPLNNSTNMIDLEDFAQNASITVKEKVTDATDSTPATYKTDITFSLAVQADKNSDDLLVHVIVDGRITETRRLAGSNGEGETYTSISPDDNGNYKIEDLTLASGVNLTLNLTGTQNIDEGIYIYTSEVIDGISSQTFVGLAEGARTVDLSVDMNFTVTEPEAKVKDPDAAPEQVRVSTLRERKTDIETRTTLTYDVKVTTVVTEETGRKWESFREKEYSYYYDLDEQDDDWGEQDDDEDEQDDDWNKQDDDRSNDDGVHILDKDARRAKAPKTGDISALWAAISCLSIGGVILLNSKRKEEK